MPGIDCKEAFSHGTSADNGQSLNRIPRLLPRSQPALQRVYMTVAVRNQSFRRKCGCRLVWAVAVDHKFAIERDAVYGLIDMLEVSQQCTADDLWIEPARYRRAHIHYHRYSIRRASGLVSAKLQSATTRGYTPFKLETTKDSQHPDLKGFWHTGREALGTQVLRVLQQPTVSIRSNSAGHQAPNSGNRFAGFEPDQTLAAHEAVRRADHGFDGKPAAPARRGQSIARIDLEITEVFVCPQT